MSRNQVLRPVHALLDEMRATCCYVLSAVDSEKPRVFEQCKKTAIEYLQRMVRDDLLLPPDAVYTVMQSIDLIAESVVKENATVGDLHWRCLEFAKYVNSFAGYGAAR